MRSCPAKSKSYALRALHVVCMQRSMHERRQRAATKSEASVGRTVAIINSKYSSRSRPAGRHDGRPHGDSMCVGCIGSGRSWSRSISIAGAHYCLLMTCWPVAIRRHSATLSVSRAILSWRNAGRLCRGGSSGCTRTPLIFKVSSYCCSLVPGGMSVLPRLMLMMEQGTHLQ